MPAINSSLLGVTESILARPGIGLQVRICLREDGAADVYAEFLARTRDRLGIEVQPWGVSRRVRFELRDVSYVVLSNGYPISFSMYREIARNQRKRMQQEEGRS